MPATRKRSLRALARARAPAEPSWHRRERAKRSTARALVRVAAARLRLASHHSCSRGGRSGGAGSSSSSGIMGGEKGKGGGKGKPGKAPLQWGAGSPFGGGSTAASIHAGAASLVMASLTC